MIQELQSLSVGLVCGIVFSLLSLPIPAPGVLSGILGIIGIYVWRFYPVFVQGRALGYF